MIPVMGSTAAAVAAMKLAVGSMGTKSDTRSNVGAVAVAIHSGM